jgi:multidrug resistance efflux pump
MKKNVFILMSFATIFGCGNPDNETKISNQQTTIVSDVKPDLIVAVGKVEPENEIVDLSSQSGGIVKSVFKKDGDLVSKGELLVQIDDEIEQNKINEIRMQMQSQRSQIDIEKTQLQEAELNFANKKSLLTKTKRLVESGAETQQLYDDLTTEINVFEVSIIRLKSKIQLALNKLDEMAAQLKTAETELRKKQLNAPSDGILLDITVNKGEALSQFSNYAEFAPKGNLLIRAEVDELFSAEAQKGQKVEIFFTGSDKIIAVGEVIIVSPYLKKKSLFSEKANDQEDRRVREIIISIKDASNLIINSKVECKIKL